MTRQQCDRLAVSRLAAAGALAGAALLALASSAWATFPGPVGRIAFGYGLDAVCSIMPDGGPAAEVTRGAEGDFAWAPGTRPALVFSHANTATGAGASEGVASVAADGTGYRMLTELTDPSVVAENLASFSPDGTRIVYVRRNASDNKTVWVMNADGSGAHLLHDPSVLSQGSKVVPQSVRWSPDGKRIAYSGSEYSELATPSAIVLMGSDGSNPIRVARGGSVDWAPDSSRLAVVDGSGVTVMHPDGSAKTHVPGTENSAPGSPTGVMGTLSAVWSPDGSMLAYVRTNVLQTEVDISRPDGSGRRVLVRQGRITIPAGFLAWGSAPAGQAGKPCPITTNDGDAPLPDVGATRPTDQSVDITTLSRVKRTDLNRGVRVRFSCRRGARVAASLIISRKTARTLRIRTQNTTLTIAAAKVRCINELGGLVTVRTAAKYRSAIRRVNKPIRAKLVLHLSAPRQGPKVTRALVTITAN